MSFQEKMNESTIQKGLTIVSRWIPIPRWIFSRTFENHDNDQISSKEKNVESTGHNTC